MKKVVKVALGAVALIATAMTAISCSKKAEGAAGVGKVVLTVLDYQDNTSPNAITSNEKVWDAFEKANPDIIIKREILFNDAFHSKTDAYVQQGKMPDVFYMWPGGRSTAIHDKGLAKDLMPFLEKDGLVGSYNPKCIDPKAQRAGKLCEIPQCLTSSHMTYVNMKVLKDCGIDAPAKTYDELKDQIAKLNAKGYEGVLMANKDTWVMQSCLFSMVCGRLAGANWADDIVNGKAKFTDAPFLSAVKFIKQMYDDGVLTEKSLNTDYGSVVGQFATGKGGYMIDGDWRVGAFITSKETGEALISPADQEANIELINFPAIPGEVLSNSDSGTLGVGYGMSSAIEAGSAKEDAAWRLIKWLSGPECNQLRFENDGTFPAWTGEGISKDGLEPLTLKRAAFYQIPDVTTPVFDSVFQGDVNNVINTELQRLGLGETTPEKVCADVQAAFDAQ